MWKRHQQPQRLATPDDTGSYSCGSCKQTLLTLRKLTFLETEIRAVLHEDGEIRAPDAGACGSRATHALSEAQLKPRTPTERRARGAPCHRRSAGRGCCRRRRRAVSGRWSRRTEDAGKVRPRLPCAVWQCGYG